MAFVHKFKSTDSGAPALSGQVGKLTDILDAILVNGYNSKTITITRTGDVATASCTSHGFVDKHVLNISGANENEYNGQVEITRIDANTFTYPVYGTPVTPATGTINAIVAPMGWTIAYTATNKRAYRQPAGSNGFYLRVDDTDAQNTMLRGYETMSDVDTGSGPFPTVAQAANGQYFYKSNGANSTARAWKIFGDKRSFICMGNLDGGSSWAVTMFGDFRSFSPGDIYNTHLLGTTTSGSMTMNGDSWGGMFATIGVRANTRSGSAVIARNVSAVSGAVETGLLGNAWSANSGGSTYGPPGSGISQPVTYPVPVGGGLMMDPCLLDEAHSTTSGPRGVLRGLWLPCHTRPLTNGDTFSGQAGTIYAGRTFEACGFGNNGQAIIQTSDWGVDG